MSTQTLANRPSGASKCISGATVCLFTFVCWHAKQVWHLSLLSFFILGHTNCWKINLRVAFIPLWLKLCKRLKTIC